MGWFGGKDKNSGTTATVEAPAASRPSPLPGRHLDDRREPLRDLLHGAPHGRQQGARPSRLGLRRDRHDEEPGRSAVTAEVDVTTVHDLQRAARRPPQDGDFFAVETHPTATFRSTSLGHDGDDFVLTGDLTLKGVTRPVTLTVEVSGFGPDAYGGTRAGFSAKGQINRRDFGVEFDARLDNGGLVVADKVDLELDVEAVLNA